LSAEAPRAAKPVETPRPVMEAPKPTGEAPPTGEEGWTPLPHGRAPGKGRIGAPRLAALPDGSLEILLPYQGSLGGETHFTPREAGIDTRLDALSVDVHGEWEFSRQTDVRIEKSVVGRAQIYPHPGDLRVSAVACASGSGAPILAARVSFSAETLRILFSSSGR
jgi:hypothetical protein